MSERCTIYWEELLEESSKLTKTSSCPYCEHKVLFHQRRPVVHSTLVNDKNASVGSANEVKSDGAEYISVMGPRPISLPSNIISQLPKKSEWNIMRKFLDEYESILSSFQIQETNPCFVSLLVLCMDSANDRSWVKKNIVDRFGANKDLQDWKDVKAEFIKHFENFAYRDRLKQEFFDCNQKPGESVQNFIHRWTVLKDELGYRDDDTTIIDQFLASLLERVRLNFEEKLNALNTVAEHIPNAKKIPVDTMRQVTDLLLSFNRYDGNKPQSNNGDKKPNNHYNNGGRKETKKCKFHPDSTSHSTNECRSPEAVTERRTANDSPQGKSSSDGKTMKKMLTKNGQEVVCFTCKGNHFQNKCPVYLAENRTTTRGQSANSNTASSAGQNATDTKQQQF
jgi:DNA-directed RNA polymerase subunit RPC12/RpoP